MQIAHTLEIAAPVDRVWDLTVDVESWPRLTPTMTRVERLDDGPLRPGSTVRITQPRQRPRVWTVTELVPGSRFCWTTTVLGAAMAARHLLAPTETGARNTLVVELEGRAGRLIGTVLGRALRRALATENEGFRRAAEGVTA